MLYLRLIPLTAFVVACGDNTTPSDLPPDGGPGAVCTSELAATALDSGSYDPRFTVSGFSGLDGRAPTVYDFARDTDGTLVAAGQFEYLDGERVEPLLRFKDGAWVPAREQWELMPPGAGFAAVAIDPTGGMALATHDSFGERDGEIWLDDGTGLRVIGTFTGLVRRLVWHDGQLWAAGAHTLNTIPNLAVWDGTTWVDPLGGTADGPVFEVVKDGDDLLVAGSFTHVGGIPAASVAAFDGTAWTALNFPDVTVYALARDVAGDLYAGGTFGLAFGDTGGFARWTGTAWELAGGGLANGFIIGVATDVVQHDGSLYVSGCFTSAGGALGDPDAVTTIGIARFDGEWHALDDGIKGVLSPWFEPRACGDEGPLSVWDVSKQKLFSDDGRLLVGGTFPGIAGVVSQAIIALEGETWTAQGATGLGVSGSIDHIAASGNCDVWGLGQLTHAAGTPTTTRLLHFTGDAWQPIDDSIIPPDGFCPGLAVSPAGEVSISCMVDVMTRIYRVEGTALVQVGGDLPLVQTIAYDLDGTLWVAGGASTGFVGRIEDNNLVILEDGFDAAVTHLSVAGPTDIVAAGAFTSPGNRIARWDGSTWQALGEGLPGTPSALAHAGDRVYVSTLDEGNGQLMLGAFDGTTWTELATPGSGLTPMSFYNFNAIRIVGDAVVAAGSATLDDGSARGVLVFEGGRFRSLGGGVHASSLSDLAITSDAIWVAGAIAEAGPEASLVSTIGVARYVIE